MISKYKITSFGLLFLLTVISFSCKDGKQANGVSAKENFDYLGHYEGKLPCQNCKAVQLSVNLMEKNNFRLIKQYKGGPKNGMIKTKTGKFEWNDAGTIITLKIDPEEKFRVKKGKLIMLSPAGKKMEAGNRVYVLQKMKKGGGEK